LAWACAPAGEFDLRSGPGGAQAVWLDEPLRLELSGRVDPASVTPRSLALSTPAGRSLERRVRVTGRAIEAWVRVDQALLADPPEGLVVTLQGAPSLHALAAVDGRLLARSWRWQLPLKRGLSPGAPGAPRLISVNGVPLGSVTRVLHEGELRLVFAGRVDPDSVTPAACALLPVAAGLNMDPLLPQVRWVLEGERFVLLLTLPAGTGTLELRTRRLGLTGMNGEAVEPLASVRVQTAASPR